MDLRFIFLWRLLLTVVFYFRTSRNYVVFSFRKVILVFELYAVEPCRLRVLMHSRALTFPHFVFDLNLHVVVAQFDSHY
jgi:hypothetical protein